MSAGETAVPLHDRLGLERIRSGREVGRRGGAGDIDIAARIHCDARQAIDLVTAQIGGIEEGGAVQLRRRIDLGDE